jgi:hypothetical protein
LAWRPVVVCQHVIPEILGENEAAVDRMRASIREYGSKVLVLARSKVELADGHWLKGAKKLGITEGSE